MLIKKYVNYGRRQIFVEFRRFKRLNTRIVKDPIHDKILRGHIDQRRPLTPRCTISLYLFRQLYVSYFHGPVSKQGTTDVPAYSYLLQHRPDFKSQTEGRRLEDFGSLTKRRG